MHTDLALPRWAKYAAGGVLLAVAVTAGGLSLSLNVSYGLEAGLAAGVTFGLAETAKIVIPIVAGVIGWSLQMRITAAICVTVSLWCAVNYYADTQGRDLLTKQHGEKVYADAEKQIAELGAEAARLSSLASEEAKRGGCRTNCRALTDEASSASQRLEAARESRAALTPVEPSGLAAMIAAASDANADHIARSIGAVKAVMFLALLEALVWLSVPAMALLAMVARYCKVEPEGIATPVVVPTKARPAQKSTASGTRSYYLQRLERAHPALAKRVLDGELSVYRACILAGLRKPPAKDWSKPAAYGIKAGETSASGNLFDIRPE